jgi:antitoxin component of RelBE/YafQ-DinJ toxin-antitoxin module
MTVTEIFADENRVVEREATPEEVTQREATAAYFKQLEEEKAAKAEAKTVVLDRLGLTADEAALLLG